MKRSEWRKTPFSDLEEAHKAAELMKLCPSAIMTTGASSAPSTPSSSDTIRYFQVVEGRAVTMIAQRLDGGPVLEKTIKSARGTKNAIPEQDPSAPRFSDRDRLKAGPWILSDDCETLEDVWARWQREFVNPENIEILQVTLYRVGAEEYEYAQDEKGIWVRVLTPRKN